MKNQLLAVRGTRRRFAFWVGFGLFSLGEQLGAAGWDRWAAAAMQWGGTSSSADEPSLEPPLTEQPLEHWTAAENAAWRWYERETWIDGQWRLTGVTAPVNKATGEPLRGRRGYLEESLVPQAVRNSGRDSDEVAYAPDGEQPGQPNAARRARHGRPPSQWLRSLKAAELRIWLKTIEVPEVGVGGMTFWVHLTRDHSFDPDHLQGLTEQEQAKLHAAAHYGY